MTVLKAGTSEGVMNNTGRLSTGSLRNLLLSMAVMTGGLFLAAVPRLHAETIDKCQHRIEHAEHELHEAIEHHGRRSRQADHERHELRSARERCWRERHQWWDEHEHRWHRERDWDDRDHDRD